MIFRVSKFSDYGKLANINFDDVKIGERVENDEYDKEEIRDFALWKGYKDDDIIYFLENDFNYNIFRIKNQDMFENFNDIRFQFDYEEDLIFIKIDKAKKISAYVFLKALGLKDADIKNSIEN